MGSNHLLALHHVQLAMPEGQEADAVAFYVDVLGLAEVAKPPQLAGRGGCWFTGGDIQLHLGVDRPFTPARKAHPAFLVDDLAAVKRQLEQAGVPVVLDEQLEGYERFYASDPFGNRLEFIAPAR